MTGGEGEKEIKREEGRMKEREERKRGEKVGRKEKDEREKKIKGCSNFETRIYSVFLFFEKSFIFYRFKTKF